MRSLARSFTLAGMVRFAVLIVLLSLGCGSGSADPAPAPPEDVGLMDSTSVDPTPTDVAVSESAAETTSDTLEAGDAPACTCVSVASGSYYRQGAMLNSGDTLSYYVSSLVLGPAMRKGRYKIYAPPNTPEPPYTHTVELRDEDGKVLATHDYHWHDEVSYLTAYTFKFGEFASISLMCRDGCSMSLWGIPNAFDGEYSFITQCCP
jgi:hypothetical protein